MKDGKTNKTNKRRCQQCGKPLSIYNDGPNCYAHSDEHEIHRYVPITACTSYKPEFPGSGLIGKKPGDKGYNEMAFSKVVEVKW